MIQADVTGFTKNVTYFLGISLGSLSGVFTMMDPDTGTFSKSMLIGSKLVHPLKSIATSLLIVCWICFWVRTSSASSFFLTCVIFYNLMFVFLPLYLTHSLPAQIVGVYST
jgi:hypothetical protein